MPKFYCEYCGIYLTHSSPSGRAQHSKGRKHINNRIEYYRQVIHEQQYEQNDARSLPFPGNNNIVMPNVLPGMGPGGFPPINVPPTMLPPGAPIIPGGAAALQPGGISQISINSSLPTNHAMAGLKPAQIQAQPLNLGGNGPFSQPPPPYYH